MKFSDADFSVAINSLVTGVFEQTHRCAIDAVVLSGAASKLIHDTLARVRGAVGNDEKAVQQVITILEALSEISPLSARILMATLWPIAGRLLLHDVCDAIDLWVVNETSDDLKSQLRKIMESERDEGSRRHLERLLQNHL